MLVGVDVVAAVVAGALGSVNTFFYGPGCPGHRRFAFCLTRWFDRLSAFRYPWAVRWTKISVDVAVLHFTAGPNFLSRKGRSVLDWLRSTMTSVRVAVAVLSSTCTSWEPRSFALMA